MSIKIRTPEKHYEETKELRKEDVLKMLEWLQMQPHLPTMSEPEMIIFLHSCYYNQEATKKCLDSCWSARTHTKEIFGNYDVHHKDISQSMKIMMVTPLKGLTPRGNVVFYTRGVDFRPELFNSNSCVALFDMRTILYGLENRLHNGAEVILDFFGGTLSHLTKVNLVTLKKVVYYVQEGIPVRLKAIHCVNPPTFMDKIVSILKSVVKKELMEMVQVHNNFQSLHKVISRDILPPELGGNADTVNYYHEQMKKVLLENNDIFLDVGKRHVDETKRPGKPTNVSKLFGVEGTFNKLNID